MDEGGVDQRRERREREDGVERRCCGFGCVDPVLPHAERVDVIANQVDSIFRAEKEQGRLGWRAGSSDPADCAGCTAAAARGWVCPALSNPAVLFFVQGDAVLAQRV